MPMPLTPSNPMTALVNLNLDRVALCNQGANSRAHILLTKRKETKNMTVEELLKAMTPEQAKVITDHLASITKAKDESIAQLTGEVTTLKSTVTSLTEQVEKSKPAVPQPAATPSAEEVLKSASPEIKSLFEGMQNTMNTLVAAQEENLAKSRFEAVKALPVEEATLKGVLKSASPAVFEVLKAAAAAVTATTKAVGTNVDGEMPGATTGAYATLEKSAKEIQKSNAGLTYEQAFTKACEADPAAYTKYCRGEE